MFEYITLFIFHVALLDVLNDVVVQVKSYSMKRNPHQETTADPPSMTTQSPIVVKPQLSNPHDITFHPVTIQVEYNTPNLATGQQKTCLAEGMSEDKSSSLSFPSHPPIQEGMEIVVGENIDIMPVVETFNVDEIPRAAEMVEIVEDQSDREDVMENTLPTHHVTDTGLPLNLSCDPLLQAACSMSADTFVGALLARYGNSDDACFWAGPDVPGDDVKSQSGYFVSTVMPTADLSMDHLTSDAMDHSPAYICPNCRECFTVLHQFQDHLLTHPDPEDKKFLCQFCGKRFLRADHLNRHSTLHKDVAMYKCRTCGEEFGRASHLDKHRRRMHASTAANKIPIKTGGKRSEGCNLHLLAAVASPEGHKNGKGSLVAPTVNDVVVSGSSVPIVQVEETVVAEGYQSFDDSLMEPSGTSAEPSRPFACDQCGRKFIRITHLRRHKRIHTGEKPFVCHICGRRYARGDYLRAHIQAHRREKMHKCKVCGEVFLDLARFSEHCRSHSNDEFDQAEIKVDKKVSSDPFPLLSDAMHADIMQRDIGEIVSMVIVPSSEEVVISNSDIVTVDAGSNGTSHSQPNPPVPTSSNQPVNTTDAAIKALLQESSRNVNLHEAIVSLGKCSKTSSNAPPPPPPKEILLFILRAVLSTCNIIV